jgi:molybdopterin-guanine dinucleotide biosynthesis protein A
MKIAALQLSTGHNYFGHHGRPPDEHPMTAATTVDCLAGRGLRGDRFLDYKPAYAGQITFFAEEVHQALLAALQLPPRSAAAYRRNVITRGVELNGLIGQEFTVQGIRFFGTAECKPCYWMEQAIGLGAEAWLRDRGGLRAKILSDGPLHVDCATAAGLLLAGGHSRRMGTDKAQLDWHGRPLIEHQAATLAATGAWPLLLSCRPEQSATPVGFQRVEDQSPDGGALRAFVDALNAAPTPVLAVLAVDLPLATADFLTRLTGLARDTAVSVVPQHADGYEPMAAAWHRSALPVLRAALGTGQSLQQACAILQTQNLLQPHPLTPNEITLLTNLNRPSDRTQII